jgi:hypothetical protein
MDTLVVCMATAASILLFSLAGWLTRASYWRIAAALLSGLVAAGFAFGLDRAAFEFGWWSYGEMEMHAPVATYAATALWFGAGMGLIGWRAMREWGGRGEAAFFLLFPLVGVARDFALASTGSGFSLGAGWIPVAVSAAGWLAIAFIVQVGMQLLVGGIDSDPLEPEHLPVLDPVAWPADAEEPGVSFVRYD